MENSFWEFLHQHLKRISTESILLSILIVFISIICWSSGIIGSAGADPPVDFNGIACRFKENFLYGTDDSWLSILVPIIIQVFATAHLDLSNRKRSIPKTSAIGVTGLVQIVVLILVVMGLPGITSKCGWIVAFALTFLVSSLISVSWMAVRYSQAETRIKENEELVCEYRKVEDRYKRIFEHLILRSKKNSSRILDSCWLNSPRKMMSVYYAVSVLVAGALTIIGYRIDSVYNKNLSCETLLILLALNLICILCIVVINGEIRVFIDPELVQNVKSAKSSIASELYLYSEVVARGLGIFCFLMTAFLVGLSFSIGRGEVKLSFAVPLLSAVIISLFFYFDSKVGKKVLGTKKLSSSELDKGQVPMKLLGRFYVSAELQAVSNLIKDLNRRIKEDKKVAKPNADDENGDQITLIFHFHLTHRSKN